MNVEQNQHTRSEKVGKLIVPMLLLLVPISMLYVMSDMINRSLEARAAHEAAQQATTYIDNDGLQELVTNFFTKYDAAEMIPIIECESHFRHFGEDGLVLKNSQGSSATGVAQILASVHPDPQVIKKYNRRNLTNFSTEDFDVKTLTGNLSYALVLYKTRGVGDWECSKLI